jgi:CheY-like chemotaxis protein
MAQVLLVDGDAGAAARNRAALTARGHAVVIASDPTECAAEVRRHLPDVVVMDAVLGGVPAGFDLARALAREFPHLPLIMLSGLDDGFDADERAKQDRDGSWLPVGKYMQKPVPPEIVVAEVDHILPGAH